MSAHWCLKPHATLACRLHLLATTQKAHKRAHQTRVKHTQGVAKNFREVFAALVPGGRGELVMQRRHQVCGMGGTGGTRHKLCAAGPFLAGLQQSPTAPTTQCKRTSSPSTTIAPNPPSQNAGGDEEEEEAEGAPPPPAAGGAIGKYSGVRVRVSFARGAETTSLRSLSGGQKTLVALALIFAIQRCDPVGGFF